MTKSDRRRLAMTKRDEKLLRYLFVNKVATTEDIREDIFNNISRQTVNRRLVKLAHAGLIRAITLRDKKNLMAHSLTTKGFDKYISDKTSLLRVQLKSDCIEHDLTLLKIKRELKKLDMVLGYYSENLVRSGIMDYVPEIKIIGQVLPDAIIKLKIEGKILFVPLEYEASSKYSKKNDSLILKYYIQPDIPGVLFISKSASIEKKIVQKELGRGTKRKGKFYFSLLENVIGGDKKVTFKNVKGDTLEIV